VKLLVYPTVENGSEQPVTAENVKVADHQKNLYAHLLANSLVEPIRKYDPANLNIRSTDVLAKLQAGDPAWEKMALPEAVELIKSKGLFGYRAPAKAA